MTTLTDPGPAGRSDLTPAPSLAHVLAGSTVLVVGGSSGIGAAACRELASAGAEVLAVSRSGRVPEGLSDTQRERVTAIAADMQDGEVLQAALADRKPDHVVVTAAEILGGPVVATPYEKVEGTIAGWLRGAYEVARVTGPLLPPHGSLTFFSGYASARPVPGAGAAAAAGAGIEALARTLAVELAPVRVNTVRAGSTDTPLLRQLLGGADDTALAAVGATLPVRRIATPAETAAVAIFLMTHPYVTGSVLTADGGASIA